MKWATAVSSVCFATIVAALPQGVTKNIPAQGAPPPGCKTSYPGEFQIVVNKVQKRSIEVRSNMIPFPPFLIASGANKATAKR